MEEELHDPHYTECKQQLWLVAKRGWNSLHQKTFDCRALLGERARLVRHNSGHARSFLTLLIEQLGTSQQGRAAHVLFGLDSDVTTPIAERYVRAYFELTSKVVSAKYAGKQIEVYILDPLTKIAASQGRSELIRTQKLSVDLQRFEDALEQAARQLYVQQFESVEAVLSRYSDSDDLIHSKAEASLKAKCFFILGATHRDQGHYALSKEYFARSRSYCQIIGLQVGIARAELQMAVLVEMSDENSRAAQLYERYSQDGRLSTADRTLARLWWGSALTKIERADLAEPIIRKARKELYDTGHDGIVGAHMKWSAAVGQLSSNDNACRILDDIPRQIFIPPLLATRLCIANAIVAPYAGERTRLIAQAENIARRCDFGHQLDKISRLRSVSSQTS